MSATIDKKRTNARRPVRALALLDPDDETGAWRSELYWPLGIEESRLFLEAQTADARTWIGGVDDPTLRNAALLALPLVLAYARMIALQALAAHRLEEAGGGTLVGDAPEITFLTLGRREVPVRDAAIAQPDRVWLEWARRLARTKSWTPLHGMPRVALFPAATAVTHNPLLRAEAARGSKPVGFRHGHLWLDKIRRRISAPDPAIDESVTASFAEALLPAELPDGEYRLRAQALVAALTRHHVALAATDMVRLAKARLPREIWSGSGGTYPARALGLEILRRGGRAVRFDHGTPKGFIDHRTTNNVLEFDVSSDYVQPGERAVSICREYGEAPPLPGRQSINLIGGKGDPIFSRAVARDERRRRGPRPRIVYAPSILTGFRQLMPPMLSDPIYLDWQIRLTEALSDLPADLICQPHPEGMFMYRAHPLERIAPTRRGDFTARLGETDVFVFDYPSTTALWEAVCTEARVVYLDLGMGHVTPGVREAFEARCHVIPVSFDSRNRPVLYPEKLREAVLGGSDRPDPSWFRRLLTDDE